MGITQAIKHLRERGAENSAPRPTREETVELEGRIRDLNDSLRGSDAHGPRFELPPDLREYLVTAGDLQFGTLEPATIGDLPALCRRAWQEMGVSLDLLPFCYDNGDAYCLTAGGEVVFWSHNGVSTEKWDDLADWIETVWIGDYEDDDLEDTVIVQFKKAGGAGEEGWLRIERVLSQGFSQNGRAVVRGHRIGASTWNILIGAPPHEFAWQGKLGEPVVEVITTYLEHLKVLDQALVIMRTGNRHKVVWPRRFKGEFEKLFAKS